MKIYTMLIILSMLIPSLGYAQADPTVNVQVKGLVVDSLTSETVPYATIKVASKANPKVLVKAVAANENGKFQFPMTKKGDYLLSVEYTGKNSVARDLVIGDNKNIDLGTIAMSDNTTALSEIVISAQKPLVKVDLDKITYSMADDPEAKTNNVLEMLKKVPMVTVDGEENIQLKGSSNFKIYMNGKPSNMISSNPKDVLRSMPAGSVKDIQVITDPGAKYDAEGVAGIINIITQQNSSMGGYTATLNARVDHYGGFGGGAYLSLKQGKIGFTGNYNYYEYRRPAGSFSSYTEYLSDSNNKYLTQAGSSKRSGNGQYGSGEISYEIDTLNLINIGFNRYYGNGKNTNDLMVEMLNAAKNIQYQYGIARDGKENYGGTDMNIDYQRTFKKKDQLLTASYKLSLNPNDSESDNIIVPKEGVLPSHAITNNQFSDADMKEHTFQIDFVTPFGKVHSLETGVKYIIRLNESTSGYDFLNSSGVWENRPSLFDKFKHEQDIIAAYGGYSAKFKKWGVKTGLRYEATTLEANFPKDLSKDFKADYSNLVPSATLTYQIKPAQNLRFGYNMRISRPGIWQLNPYENTSDPNTTRVGNPNLDAVKTHSVSVNYGSFSQKLNFNTNLSYDIENNSIENVSIPNNGILTIKPYNVADRKSLNLSAYVNWSPSNKLRIYSNASARYMDIKSNDISIIDKSNSGFSGNLFGGLQYTLPADFKVYLNTGFFTSHISLQGKNDSFFFHGLSASKGFMKDRLNIRAFAGNPFLKERRFKDTMRTPQFYQETRNTFPMRHFGISVSFRFGEMKEQIKKTKRSISNDDTIKGGQGGDQSGGGQGGGQN